MVTKDKTVCELNLPHVRFSDSLPLNGYGRKILEMRNVSVRDTAGTASHGVV